MLTKYTPMVGTMVGIYKSKNPTQGSEKIFKIHIFDYICIHGSSFSFQIKLCINKHIRTFT